MFLSSPEVASWSKIYRMPSHVIYDTQTGTRANMQRYSCPMLYKRAYHYDFAHQK